MGQIIKQYTSKTVLTLKKILTQRLWKVYNMNFRIAAVGTMKFYIDAGSMGVGRKKDEGVKISRAGQKLRATMSLRQAQENFGPKCLPDRWK